MPDKLLLNTSNSAHGGLQTFLLLLGAGLGVFLPLRFFERLAVPGVVYRPVEDAPVVDIVAVWRRDVSGANPVVAAFLDVARSVLEPGERGGKRED